MGDRSRVTFTEPEYSLVENSFQFQTEDIFNIRWSSTALLGIGRNYCKVGAEWAEFCLGSDS